jgi:uncharacterized protein YnzC (UPF0291/DUF896 family)
MNNIFTKLDTKKIVIELLNAFEKANFDYYSRAYLESRKGTFACPLETVKCKMQTLLLST